MPTFTIIIPAHNEQEWIARCLDSVRAQTCPDWEVLLVDDCSTDRTGKIADRYHDLDYRIKVFHSPANGGWSFGRNWALEHVSGDWVMFLDGDDYLDPEALANGAAAIKKYDPDYVIGGSTIEIYDAETREVVSQTPCQVSEDYCFTMDNFSEAGRHVWKNTSGLGFYCVWGKLFKMDIIRAHSLRFDLNLYVQEDFNFVMRYYYHVNRAVAIPHTFNYYTRPTDKDDIGEKPVIDQHNFNEVTLISILRIQYKWKTTTEFNKWLWHEISEQYVRLTSKIFLPETGLSEAQRREHVYAQTDNFIFRFFCDQLADCDPLWTDMAPLRAADDFEGMYLRMKEKVEKDLLPPCL